MKQVIYVGTYTHGKPVPGIFVYDFDDATGRLTLRQSVGGANDPSFLALAPDRRCLIATNETTEFEGQSGGGVQSYAVDAETGELRLLGGAPSLGEHPAHLTFDQDGRWAFVANYSGGSLAMIPVFEDGSLGDPSSFIQHHGRSVHPDRQTSPHVH